MNLSDKTLFVANRGEIAVRINRAAASLGMKVVQAFSEADADMLAVKMADEAVCVGPPQAGKSYLNIDQVVAAAKDAGADAVHPGYGFLAENPRFANAVEDAGMRFVGPSGAIIAQMGDKVAARAAAKAANVPTVPGSEGRVEDLAALPAIADATGFPVMIKAAAGGGGRGIRIARNVDELTRLAPQAQAEAQAAFGDGGLYLERMVENARHIEVQILADGVNAIHLFERECSLQRRRQKVWEEAPAACLSGASRARICEASARLAQSVGYRSAGTLEYLYDPSTDAFFFLEMNTRIQVEHPVTEAITGVDLVAEMIRIAFGAPLSVRQDDLAIDGHAIEVRVNAEDPANDFMPFPGICSTLSTPPGARFDTMLYDGYAIPPFYDSLVGKLIVHGADRAAALQALRDAIGDMRIDGLKTTLPLHAALAAAPEVIADNLHTQFLEPWLEVNPIQST